MVMYTRIWKLRMEDSIRLNLKVSSLVKHLGFKLKGMQESIIKEGISGSWDKNLILKNISFLNEFKSINIQKYPI